MTNLIALIKKESNYRSLNGRWVTIKKFYGHIVECIIESENEPNVPITTTFKLTEIEEIIELPNK
jgi:hypothetical protein